MRNINKGNEPRVLMNYKAQGGKSYKDGSLQITDIQEQLLKEQKGLCGYCMDRISAIPGRVPKMNVEHILCREHYPDLELEYTNMLGVCLGGSENRGGKLHCDKSKDRNGIHYELKKLNPLNSDVESLIQFLESGKIKSVNDDKEVEKDIEALNLNEDFLRINREKILKRLKDDYKRVCKNNNRSDVVKFLDSNIRKWSQINKDGFLQPYNLVALKFLEKKKDRLKTMRLSRK
ncbi:MAG: TIGR02646 family protein [Prolixibacteraceae bacterium]|jgi:uncharacterized protein (TIGR02646 family)|nr:TIGR02646 family protein [Prolixibacteraceae bacterium]